MAMHVYSGNIASDKDRAYRQDKPEIPSHIPHNFYLNITKAL